MSGIIIGVGIAGAGVASVFVDKTKKFNETLKVMFLLGATAILSVRQRKSTIH